MVVFQEQQLESDHTPPRAKPVQYKAPLGTRWQKEKANAPDGSFDLASDPKQIGPWVLGECVGKGASGRVKVARHCETGQVAAVKILPLETVLSSRLSLRSRENKAEKHRNGIDKEIIMMKLMDHPNIVRIYDVFEGEKELFLVLEYVDGGELFDYLVNHGRMEPHKALCYFKQIIYGLAYAHAFAVIHRDLKPENILIASLDPPHVKIADWGMAAFAPPEHHLETSCGSPHYASPEIVRGEPYSGTATDIWSCGVILFALMTGRLPFDDKNIRALLQKVKSGKFEMPTYVFPEAADLITRMLVVDVNKRIKMSDILLHPFLQHSTSGITYVPAPSISELDKPLRSKALIKQDLLSSLLLICVGSTYDEIASELLSPPGQGSLIKALYFLLAKHRERTLEEYGMLNLFSNDGFNIKHYNAPPRKDKVEAGVGAHSNSDGKPALSSDPPSAGSSHVSSSSQLKSPSTSATNSRSRPASPLGPRHPRTSRISQRSRRASSPHLSPDIAGLPGSRHSDDSMAITGGSSQSSSRRKTRPRTQTVDGLPYSQQRYDPLMMSPEAHVSSVSPRTNMPPMTSPPFDTSMNWFIKPTVDDPTLQRAIDDVAKNFNILIRDAPKGVGLGLEGTECSDSIDSDSAMNGHQESNRVHLGNAVTNIQQRVVSPYNLPNKTFDAIREEDEHDKENQHIENAHLQAKEPNVTNWRDDEAEASRERSSDDDDDFQKIEKCDVENDVAIAKLRMKTHRRGIPKKAKCVSLSLLIISHPNYLLRWSPQYFFKPWFGSWNTVAQSRRPTNLLCF